MPLITDRRLTPVSDLDERANEAVRERPDLAESEEGRRWLAAAREVGPAAVIALCKNHPTPEEATAAERKAQFELVLKDAREQAARAAEAVAALDGSVPGGDSTRREVFEVIGSLRAAVQELAEWAKLEQRGERATPTTLRYLVNQARIPELRQALHRTHSIVQSAIAESHVPKRRKK